MNRSRLITAAAVLGLAASTLGLAGTASAAEAAPAAASAPALAGRPNILDTNYATVNWNSEPPTSTSYACNGGADYQLPAGLPGTIFSVWDNCSVRVWLHQNSNGSGYGFCISPHKTFAVPFLVYRQLQITVNTAAC
jgi:hypothetical protein